MGKKSPPPGRPTRKVAFDLERFAREMDERARSGDFEKEGVPSNVRSTAVSREHAVSDEQWASNVTACPVVAMPTDQLRHHVLDATAGFLLSLMDGKTDLGTIVTVSDMPRDEVLRRIREMVEFGIVELR